MSEHLIPVVYTGKYPKEGCAAFYRGYTFQKGKPTNVTQEWLDDRPSDAIKRHKPKAKRKDA